MKISEAVRANQAKVEKVLYRQIDELRKTRDALTIATPDWRETSEAISDQICALYERIDSLAINN